MFVLNYIQRSDSLDCQVLLFEDSGLKQPLLVVLSGLIIIFANCGSSSVVFRHEQLWRFFESGLARYDMLTFHDP